MAMLNYFIGFLIQKKPPANVAQGLEQTEEWQNLGHGVHALGIEHAAFFFQPLGCGLAVPHGGFRDI